MAADASRDLRNVIVMALVDGELDEREKQYIESLRRRLNIDEAEFRRLCQAVREDPRRLSLPRDPAGAEETFRLLVAAARANGQVRDAERRVLKLLADRAGLAADRFERILAECAAAAGEAPAGDVDQARVNAAITGIYESLAGWDLPERRRRLADLRSLGPQAVLALLKILESYRTPDGMDSPAQLKALAAEQLGELGDARAAYYLAQHVMVSEFDEADEESDLPAAAAEALGRIVGKQFPRDPSGVAAARAWWYAEGAKKYDQLAF